MDRAIATNTLSDRAGTLIENPLFNALWFDLAWFCLVVGQERLLPASVLIIAFHLLFVAHKGAEYRSLALLACTGIAVDSLLTVTGVFEFSASLLIPWWLVLLWVAFAATLSRSLTFLAKRLPLSILVGAAAGPVSYWAGYKLGAVDFGFSVMATLMLLSLVWAVLFPALLKLSQWSCLDRGRLS